MFKNANLSFLGSAIRESPASAAGSASSGPCRNCKGTGTTLFGPCVVCARPTSAISGEAAEAAMLREEDAQNLDEAAYFWSPGASLQGEPDITGALYFKPQPPAGQ